MSYSCTVRSVYVIDNMIIFHSINIKTRLSKNENEWKCVFTGAPEYFIQWHRDISLRAGRISNRGDTWTTKLTYTVEPQVINVSGSVYFRLRSEIVKIFVLTYMTINFELRIIQSEFFSFNFAGTIFLPSYYSQFRSTNVSDDKLLFEFDLN